MVGIVEPVGRGDDEAAGAAGMRGRERRRDPAAQRVPDKRERVDPQRVERARGVRDELIDALDLGQAIGLIEPRGLRCDEAEALRERLEAVEALDDAPAVHEDEGVAVTARDHGGGATVDVDQLSSECHDRATLSADGHTRPRYPARPTDKGATWRFT